MLSNFGKAKFERIEPMLKMLSQCTPALKIDSDTLRDFLKIKQNEGAIILEGEHYKLRKA